MKNIRLFFLHSALFILFLYLGSWINLGFAAEVIKLSPHLRVIDVDPKTKRMQDLIEWRKSFKDMHLFEENEIEKAPRVISDIEANLVSIPGDRVYVSNLSRIDYNQPLGVYRLGAPIKSRTSNKIYGYPAYLIADIKLKNIKDLNIKHKLSLLSITNMTKEVQPGDKVLVKTKLEKINVTSNPNKNIQGKIIHVLDGVKLATTGRSVILDIGCNQGAKVGNIFKVIEDKTVRRVVTFYERNTFDKKDKNNNNIVTLPDLYMGKVLVYQTYNNISLALVIESRNSISVNQLIKNTSIADNSIS